LYNVTLPKQCVKFILDIYFNDIELAKWSKFVDSDSTSHEQAPNSKEVKNEKIVEPVEDPFCLTQFLSHSVLVPITAQ